MSIASSSGKRIRDIVDDIADLNGPHLESTHLDLECMASLMLEDVDEITALRRGKRREDAPTPDDEVALDLFTTDLKTLLAAIEDHTLACSLATAVAADGGLIEELAQLDNRILQDRAYAVRVARGETLMPSLPQSTPASQSGSRVSHVMTPHPPRASSSGLGSSSGVVGATSLLRSSAEPPPYESEDCAACGDAIGATDLEFPCQHFYHARCAVQLFKQSINDESLWPPRCCRQPVPTDMVLSHLSEKDATSFSERLRERSTANRLYCPVAKCSHFIGPASTLEERADVRCPKCGTEVCTACKNSAHRDEPCSADADAQMMLALAESEGWKRCPGCRRMVELDHGCFHMTCLCRTQFCYLCSAQWKTCSCRQWDEERLTRTAQREVNNRLAGLPAMERAAMAPRHQLVAEAVQRLRADHVCEHPRWRGRRGGTCDNCHNYLPLYLLRCDSCQMRACARCRRNRL